MRRWLIPIAAVLAVLMAVGLWTFEPWRLWTESQVNEPEPGVGSIDEQSVGARKAGPSGQQSSKPKNVDLAEGDFEDAEHATSGSARVIKVADGSRLVRLEDLESSDGPDLHVWLSDQPSGGEWGSYDDGRYLRLGELKATNGNQNYELPEDVDLDGLTSVVIWCDRFNVAFGTAPIDL